MILVRLIYASHFCQDKFDTKELARINESSNKNNGIQGITGSLIFGEDFFLQCIEGGRAAVSELFHKISNDPRHDSVTILSMDEIVQRDFSEWKMKFVILTEANQNIIREFSRSSNFNPLEMQPKNALELMKAMKK